MSGSEILARAIDVIINPLIILIFAAGFVLFLWGLVVFMANTDSSEERKKGTQHMLWGIVGMFIMVAVYSIIAMVLNTFGVPTPKL